MVSPVLNEHFYDGAFLVREANGFLSRDLGEIVNATESDVTFEGGLVVSAGGTARADVVTGVENTGNGTAGAVTVASGTVPGNYVVAFTAPTAFTVSDFSGNEIGAGTTGTAFSGGGLAFTIAAGTTAFVAGDGFTIVVVANDAQYVPYTGATAAVGILFNLTTVPSLSYRKVTIVKRMAEVNGAELQWDASVTGAANATTLQAQALASLAAAGIVAR
ncbi:phage protein Gp19 [Gluconacetobacter sacchari DSM 12717]|nr:phage protein Gp19 [Gluconacetobacter sacchari DSM 12717]